MEKCAIYVIYAVPSVLMLRPLSLSRGRFRRGRFDSWVRRYGGGRAGWKKCDQPTKSRRSYRCFRTQRLLEESWRIRYLRRCACGPSLANSKQTILRRSGDYQLRVSRCMKRGLLIVMKTYNAEWLRVARRCSTLPDSVSQNLKRW